MSKWLTPFDYKSWMTMSKWLTPFWFQILNDNEQVANSLLIINLHTYSMSFNIHNQKGVSHLLIVIQDL
jgi:hypothetical protein